MDPGWPLKAKKKVIQDPFVEPKLTIVKGRLPKPSMAQGSLGVGFVVAHRALMELLPTGLRGLLPVVELGLAKAPSECDYGQFVAWLRLPRLTSGNPSPDWARRFAHPLGMSRRRVLDLLATLVELGAEPQDRQEDLYHAWWELENMEPAVSVVQLSGDPQDSRVVMASSDQRRLATDPAILASLGRLSNATYATGAGGWNQRSVLSTLGYAVGWSGTTVANRRIALRACIVMPDDMVPDGQRDFWGSRASHRRVRAIERMISLFISLAEHRTSGSWARACEDWEDDLQWLRTGECLVSMAGASA